jgi:hypothetical protein
MENGVGIENIYEMRRREGHANVALRNQIRNLQVGDSVKLTFLTGTQAFAGETLMVRITSITGPAFRGKLAKRPTFSGLCKLRVGSYVTFTRDHILGVPKDPAGPRR